MSPREPPGVRGQQHNPRFAALAVNGHLSGALPLGQVAPSQPTHLRIPQAAAIEHRQQGAVAQAVASRDKHPDHLRLAEDTLSQRVLDRRRFQHLANVEGGCSRSRGQSSAATSGSRPRWRAWPGRPRPGWRDKPAHRRGAALRSGRWTNARKRIGLALGNCGGCVVLACRADPQGDEMGVAVGLRDDRRGRDRLVLGLRDGLGMHDRQARGVAHGGDLQCTIGRLVLHSGRSRKHPDLQHFSAVARQPRGQRTSRDSFAKPARGSTPGPRRHAPRRPSRQFASEGRKIQASLFYAARVGSRRRRSTSLLTVCLPATSEEIDA